MKELVRWGWQILGDRYICSILPEAFNNQPTVKKRYDIHGIAGLKDQSRKPHSIAKVKVIEELEKIILELRLNNKFGKKNKVQVKEKVWS